MKALFSPLVLGICLVMALQFGTPDRARAQSNQIVYTDSVLLNGWQDYGWATRNYNNTSPVHGGTYSISVTCGAYEALYVHHPAFNPSAYSNIVFWLYVTTGGNQPLQVQGTLNGSAQSSFQVPSVPANTWTQITVPLSALGVATSPSFDGFWIQSQSGNSLPTFYVDDISLTADLNPPPTVTLTAPANGSSYASPATINLAATVVTNNQTINKVSFYNGAALLVDDTNAPYTFSWTNVGVGTYALTAKVTYNTNSTVTSGTANVTVTGVTPVTITVNAHSNVHAISPLIYGTAFASTAQLNDLNTPLNRSGGNAETRYNWQIDAHNRGADFYFESIGDGSGTPAQSDDSFISTSKAGNAQSLITVPMIGWVPKLGPGRAKLASYSIAKYGPQTGNDSSYFADAGNGISVTNNARITWNDPTDANIASDSDFQKGLIQHFTNKFGLSTNGGVKFYVMDNEHSIWFSTHQDVHPVGPTMREIRDKIFDYATMVKSVDSNAIVGAPEEWGWGGYFYSGYDQQNSGNHDRSTNGNMDYMPWLLNQIHLHDVGTGQRLLDYFTLHCYPQAGEFGNDVSTSMQTLRNQSTRQLWDTNYMDQSWIGQQAAGYNILMLIPRMKAWVNSYYPGTKIGITEYNWGAESHINGATAQADIFGIFGREGLDLATRWTTPDTGTAVYQAMKLYRNYDGSKHTFGDTSVSAAAPSPNNVSSFAALRSSDGALTVMVINKQSVSASAVTLQIANFIAAGTAQVWQLTSANTINHLSDVTLTANVISTTVPAQSITLFVLPTGIPTPPQFTGVSLTVSNKLSLSLTGTVGQTYILQSSSNLVDWVPVSSNMLASAQTNIVLPTGTNNQFYRAKLDR